MKICAIKIAEFPGIISWRVPKSIDGHSKGVQINTLRNAKFTIFWIASNMQ